jgi:hypothetical protein
MVRHTEHLYLSVLTLSEIDQGIAKARRQGASRRATLLSEWVEAVILLYANRVLPIDVAAARLAGALADLASPKGHAPGFVDVAIAATARVNDLTILTRNLRHFAPLGVPAWDPFVALPQDSTGISPGRY